MKNEPAHVEILGVLSRMLLNDDFHHSDNLFPNLAYGNIDDLLNSRDRQFVFEE